MHQITHHLYARPVQRQNARQHIIRITAAYRRHYSADQAPHISGRAIRARAEVVGAFAAHMVASRRALLARSEA